MSKWLAETELLQNIARNLLQSRQEHYSEEAIKYRIIQHPQLTQRHLRTKNKYNETLYGVLIDRREQLSEYCIIFMHGLASNILEGSSLIDHLLPNTALFCFDFSGSGKSTGMFNTYGLKEHEDIGSIVSLLELEGYKHFILWGRSMGAVACLLQGFSEERNEQVVLQVVDSPFCNFQSICDVYAKNHMNIPELFISSAISLLKETFSAHPFNPFKINLLETASKCKIPTLFVYNEKDDVIPSSNTESIIKQLGEHCFYQRIIIEDTHNNLRSSLSLTLIFDKIKKHIRVSESGKAKSRKRAIDVFSSFIKKSNAKEHENLRTTQKEEGKDKKESFRRSAIYCSLSKKNSTFFSPKGVGKALNNPQRMFFQHQHF